MSDEQPKPKSKPVAAESLPVSQLALLTGNVLEVKIPRKATLPNHRHAAAAALHGWSAEKATTGQELKLTEACYLKALEAADGPPKGARCCKPHRPACSNYAACMAAKKD